MTVQGEHTFFHGTLEVTVFHATTYTPSSPLDCIFSGGKQSYVTIKINNIEVARTNHEYDRVWNQTFRVLCAHPLTSTITITMRTTRSVLGRFQIQAQQILKESSFINGFFPLLMENGKPSPELRLRFMLWFQPAVYELSWKKVLENGEYKGLRNVTFPLRSNCHVTLYQDAHHVSTFQPPFHGSSAPRRLWEDVYKAIDNAKHLVYIAGWSFNPKMVLVRDPQTDIPYALGVKLGELLKQKAEEGVAVRLMIWDDETSLPVIKNAGIMKTHDENARAYFSNSKVVCRLCPKLHPMSPPIFSHHQKTITVDAQTHINARNREIMSFIGGLDLCDGRYDTEQHSLFHTLNTESHCCDFYQTSISGAKLQKGGPREPWHDVHARVTGEAAWDILTNFEQRWTKQSDASLLVPTSILLKLMPPLESNTNPQKDWNVQVFRSIDHLSASQVFRNLTVERTIHEAYVEAIRRAERFIYIENQYFIGGCHLWDKDQHCGCTNLIPIEIALKVANKIKAREKFAVYVVIPMWPEGPPESESVEDMLHWTRQTMTMMYRLIGEAIQETGEKAHPRDYLNFFCLANREEERKWDFVPPHSPQHATEYWSAQHRRRFMVYVHSKVMIVDDLYLLIGSANVNQRSMDGERDTEIAIGCYQLENDGKELPNGRDISTFRLSLWYEHTQRFEEVFLNPENLQCVERVRSIADESWKIYSGEEVADMKGVHLVTYPVKVKQDGSIEDLEENGGHFPDTKCPIKGRRSMFLPPIFTT
ncbi:phospholipase D alpha 4 [Cucurbita maxima]|uniref:Phospholipase D n=1 Tax=Cucurbita maxima TaxID=3661 RepID=A0A6J1KAT1_CUCMA|nr:phospholipase D alpha 4 [Cucurbita maxima]